MTFERGMDLPVKVVEEPCDAIHFFVFVKIFCIGSHRCLDCLSNARERARKRLGCKRRYHNAKSYQAAQPKDKLFTYLKNEWGINPGALGKACKWRGRPWPPVVEGPGASSAPQAARVPLLLRAAQAIQELRKRVKALEAEASSLRAQLGDTEQLRKALEEI